MLEESAGQGNPTALGRKGDGSKLPYTLGRATTVRLDVANGSIWFHAYASTIEGDGADAHCVSRCFGRVRGSGITGDPIKLANIANRQQSPDSIKPNLAPVGGVFDPPDSEHTETSLPDHLDEERSVMSNHPVVADLVLDKGQFVVYEGGLNVAITALTDDAEYVQTLLERWPPDL
jgi:hypothetical protein